MLDDATLTSYQKRFAAVRSLEQDNLLTSQEAASRTLADAGTGTFFEYRDRTCVVREKTDYEETSEDYQTKKGYFVHELTCFCLETGETVYFEWEVDDTLEIALTRDRLALRDLTDDSGRKIGSGDLDRIAGDGSGVVANSETFWYEDDWPAVFTRSGRQEQVWFYEFENNDGTRFLTVEEWQGAGRPEYRVYTSEPVSADSIQIISKGD